MDRRTGNRAQGAEDATDAERVADRLPQAEARWDLKVTQRCIEAADLNLVDDEVGPVERRASVEVRLDSEPGAGRVVDVPRDPLGRGEPLRIDVVEHDRGLGELGEVTQVGEQDAGELDAARADQGDPRHVRNCSTYALNVQE